MTQDFAMANDAELLRRYADERSEAAFAEVVRRNLNLVHSAAIRQVSGNPAAAADIAQAVFTELACQAKQLNQHRALVGWLYTTTRRMAARYVRDETRRQRREWDAHVHYDLQQDPTNPEADWSRIAPVLDEAMHELVEADRNALLLRHFQQRPYAEVGAQLGLGENAARMRVERALDRLRQHLSRRGITSTASAVVIALNGPAVAAAPAGLTANVTAGALAAGALKPSTLGLLSLMSSTPSKVGAVVVGCALLSTVLLVQQRRLHFSEASVARESVSFRVSGHISSKSGSSSRQRIEDHDQLFEITVSGCEWTINFPKNPKDQNRQFVSQRVEFDGTNCIARMLFDSERLGSRGGNNAAASVEPGLVPGPEFPKYSGQLWLAFCSGCYFRTNVSGRAAPVWTLHPIVQSERYEPPATWKLSQSPPFTPAKINYYLDDSIDFKSPNFIEDIRAIVKTANPPQTKKKRLWTAYEVISYLTNSTGLSIPKEFRYEIYDSVPPVGGGEKPILAYSVQGSVDTVEALSPAPKRENDPFADAKYLVEDFRAATGRRRIPVRYGSTDGNAISTNTSLWRTLDARANEGADLP